MWLCEALLECVLLYVQRFKHTSSAFPSPQYSPYEADALGLAMRAIVVFLAPSLILRSFCVLEATLQLEGFFAMLHFYYHTIFVILP